MNKKLLMIVLIAIGVFVVGRAGMAKAQGGTIPTRTPTPGPEQPTQVIPTATDDGPDNPPPPPATETTAPPAATSTATLPPPAASTATTQPPAATLVTAGQAATTAATAECDDTPIIEANRRMAVYAGPGGDFEILASLATGETRVILGRAGYADWWQIQLSPDVIAWVDDEDVTVHGNVAGVSIVDPPAINGATPTRGPAWNPTPPPFVPCGPTATVTATATSTATPAILPTVATDQTGAGGEAAGAAATTAPPAATSAAGSATPAATDEAAMGSGVDSRGSEDSRAAGPTSAVNLVLPIVGLGLIGGGIILALMARNRGTKPPAAPKE
ncbi:SH3 domain-containing protein [Candidatus Promineifilum breve]|nr:SH3 domain-containing protein [Candidatus Promineifilum breve]